MAFCKSCGAEIPDNSTFCPKCGAPVGSAPVTPVQDDDTPSIGLNILAFIIPLVGIILYFFYREKTPNKAKEILKWALISMAIGFVIGFISGLAG